MYCSGNFSGPAAGSNSSQGPGKCCVESLCKLSIETSALRLYIDAQDSVKRSTSSSIEIPQHSHCQSRHEQGHLHRATSGIIAQLQATHVVSTSIPLYCRRSWDYIAGYSAACLAASELLHGIDWALGFVMLAASAAARQTHTYNVCQAWRRNPMGGKKGAQKWGSAPTSLSSSGVVQNLHIHTSGRQLHVPYHGASHEAVLH